MAIVVLTFRSVFYDLEDNREGNTTGNNKDDDNNNDDIDVAQGGNIKRFAVRNSSTNYLNERRSQGFF